MHHLDVGPREKKDEILAVMYASWFDDDRCRSASGIAMTVKRGLGRIRHCCAVKHVWLQEGARSDNLKIDYVRTNDNIADILTNELPAARSTMLRGRHGVRFSNEGGNIGLIA
eukprot:2654888-Heterocapsa_arctica.AAC.1